MSCKIVWLVSAVLDVVRLKEFIEQKNPKAAKKAASRIKEAALILAENPEAGKPIDDLFPFRELFVPFGNGNYVLRYRVDGDKVVIIRIKHSREKSF